MDNTQRITLDVFDNQTYEQIYTKQYNKGFIVEFEITKDGLPFDFSNAIAVFEMKKPDKTIYVDYCNISGNILSIEINSQMTAASGRAKFQITLYDLNSYDYDTKTGDVIITTVTGVMKIDKSTVQEGDVESGDAFNIISNIITVTEVLVSEAREYASIASTSATTATEQANIAKNYAIMSESYTDNAKYYAETTKTLIESIHDEVISDTEPTQNVGDFWLKEY